MKIAHASFGVKKGFPFSPFLNFELTKMRGSGLLQLINQRNALKKPLCTEEATFDDRVQIKIQKVIFPFCIILLGIICSVIILSIEITRKCLLRRHILAPPEGLCAPEVPGVNPSGRPQESGGGDFKVI